MPLPDVSYLKLALNILLVGLVVWVGMRTLEHRIVEEHTPIWLLVSGAVFVIAGVIYLWLSGIQNMTRYLLLLELEVKGQPIGMGYSLFVLGLLAISKKAWRRFGDDA